MPDWPTTQINPISGTINSNGLASLADIQTFVRKTAATTSTAWGVANRAIYIPFVVEETVVAYQMAVENGATLNGNLDVGIYDINGVQLVASGSTAQTGTSVIQKFDIANTTLTPGYYYMAMSTNSTTATYIGNGATNAEYYRSLGVREQLTAFALPATATFANPASTTTTNPNIAIATVSVI